jgi:hypothetical protein
MFRCTRSYRKSAAGSPSIRAKCDLAVSESRRGCRWILCITARVAPAIPRTSCRSLAAKRPWGWDRREQKSRRAILTGALWAGTS